MTDWTGGELDAIGATDELEISSIGEAGDLGAFTTIWVVRIGGDLYVRPVYGQKSGWFRGTQVRHEGRVSSGGVERDVTFVDVGDGDGDLAAEIDRAYHTKYDGRYPEQYVDDCLTPQARAATLKLVPRDS
jgi:hypothetical protein